MNRNTHTKEIDGWRITVDWADPTKPMVTLQGPTAPNPTVSWTFDGNVLFEDQFCRQQSIPFDVLRQFVLTTFSVKENMSRHFDAEAYRTRQYPAPEITLRQLVEQYERGEFDPNQWNLCIGYNAVDLDGPDEGGTTKFTGCIGFYVMGDGGEQCQHVFYWPVNKMPKERLEAWIEKTFNVDHVLYGVG